MDFYQLDPPAILRAVESAGFSCSGHIHQLNSLENRVFDVRLEDSSHLVVKFYRPGRWSREAIADEHAMLFRLQSMDVPVCAPLRRDGESLFLQDGLLFAIWPRTGGRLIDEFTLPLIRRLGSYIARIHLAARDLQLTNRPVMNRQYMLERHSSLLLDEHLLPPQHIASYRERVAQLGEWIQAMENELTFQPVHGDCHTGNILHGNESLFFLDFDDSMRAPAVQDMWMIISDSPERQELKAGAFLEGYREFLEFPGESQKYIELLRALRYVAYNGWIAARREDPAIRRAFPDFGSGEYWDGFIQDLEDQCRMLSSRIPLTADTETAGHSQRLARQMREEQETIDQLEDGDYFFDLDEGRWSPGDD
ncbi:serine/threonine protein kinase [Salinispira pacifica]|uniref:Stress response kinase A n=1 Tax=Salinispira pacifica TaxID=1307761 RepID=V5WJH4_9SPIO|nr:serine/threonine protein kinase [Salinispira pacifica]AHC15785.1 YihE protein, required for LPS synthesis [Salinispira pacifica]